MAAALIVAAMLGGCGDGGAADRVQAAQTYAAEVATVTESTRRQLAATSSTANYRDAASAAATTRTYATTIRTAAERLGASAPPSVVDSEHQELIALYRSTADQLEVLAGRFEAAADDDDLTERAQELSGQVQTLSTREAQLRAAIDGALARAVPTTPPTSP